MNFTSNAYTGRSKVDPITRATARLKLSPGGVDQGVDFSCADCARAVIERGSREGSVRELQSESEKVNAVELSSREETLTTTRGHLSLA